MTMNELRLRNYRCFEDTGDIDLKPLTFLVGANSSGKSSFLKFFPLLKQSVGIRRNGVFLWYSDDVDFKDFKNTVRNGKGSIIIDMKIHIDDRIGKNDEHFIASYFKLNNIPYDGADLGVELIISEIDKNTDYLEKLIMTFCDQSICIDYSKNGNASININEEIFSDDFMVESQSYGSFLPLVIFSRDEFPYHIGPNFVRNKIIKLLKNNNVNTYIKDNFLKYFYFISQKTLKKCFETAINNQTNYTLNVVELNNLYLLYSLNNIIMLVNDSIRSITMNMSYVKPLRVMPERYYRYQNYSVNEISSDGKNLAMYFANLKHEDLKKFKEWTSECFGFELETHKLEGHVEIDIVENHKTGRNLVDTGFGYNQLLPILAIIWNSIKRDSRRNILYSLNSTKFIVIEQPELHLHPRILMKFAEMLGNIINKFSNNNHDIRFIIETHSEVIINKIGSLIQSSDLDKNMVNVVLFNAQEEGLNCYVEQASFDDNGYLINWPLGFFL